MPLRALVLNNFRWKLTALLLAMLAWFTIKLAIYKGITGRNQVVRHQPVLVLKMPDDARIWRVQPPDVDVVVQAGKEMSHEDLEVFVDLSTMPPDVESAFKQVVVRGAEVAKVIAIQPTRVVQVLRGGLSDNTLTNTLKRP